MSRDNKHRVHDGNFYFRRTVSYGGVGALGAPTLLEVEALVKRARDAGAVDTARLAVTGPHAEFSWQELGS